jgi:signal transduction histidine kinase
VAKERNRMAREIHDGLGHHLTALNMQIKAARAVMTSDGHKAGEFLQNAESLTQKALVDVRQSVSSLRLTENETRSLYEQIENSLQVCHSSGIAVDFRLIASPRPTSAEINLAILRAAQECVNNMLKHARASHASVDLDYSSPAVIRFYFQDDGIGSEILNGGFGLLGMKERVMLLEGELNVHTAKGEGFRVEILLPG